MTPSSRFQLGLPRAPRERLHLRPGTQFAVLDKGGMLYLVPERPLSAVRGLAADVTPEPIREKKGLL